jgi:hypothetical protein
VRGVVHEHAPVGPACESALGCAEDHLAAGRPAAALVAFDAGRLAGAAEPRRILEHRGVVPRARAGSRACLARALAALARPRPASGEFEHRVALTARRHRQHTVAALAALAALAACPRALLSLPLLALPVLAVPLLALRLLALRPLSLCLLALPLLSLPLLSLGLRSLPLLSLPLLSLPLHPELGVAGLSSPACAQHEAVHPALSLTLAPALRALLLPPLAALRALLFLALPPDHLPQRSDLLFEPAPLLLAQPLPRHAVQLLGAASEALRGLLALAAAELPRGLLELTLQPLEAPPLALGALLLAFEALELVPSPVEETPFLLGRGLRPRLLLALQKALQILAPPLQFLRGGRLGARLRGPPQGLAQALELGPRGGLLAQALRRSGQPLRRSGGVALRQRLGRSARLLGAPQLCRHAVHRGLHLVRGRPAAGLEARTDLLEPAQGLGAVEAPLREVVEHAFEAARGVGDLGLQVRPVERLADLLTEGGHVVGVQERRNRGARRRGRRGRRRGGRRHGRERERGDAQREAKRRHEVARGAQRRRAARIERRGPRGGVRDRGALERRERRRGPVREAQRAGDSVRQVVGPVERVRAREGREAPRGAGRGRQEGEAGAGEQRRPRQRRPGRQCRFDHARLPESDHDPGGDGADQGARRARVERPLRAHARLHPPRRGAQRTQGRRGVGHRACLAPPAGHARPIRRAAGAEGFRVLATVRAA